MAQPTITSVQFPAVERYNIVGGLGPLGSLCAAGTFPPFGRKSGGTQRENLSNAIVVDLKLNGVPGHEQRDLRAMVLVHDGTLEENDFALALQDHSVGVFSIGSNIQGNNCSEASDGTLDQDVGRLFLEGGDRLCEKLTRLLEDVVENSHTDS